jgi:hypothetical protein
MLTTGFAPTTAFAANVSPTEVRPGSREATDTTEDSAFFSMIGDERDESPRHATETVLPAAGSSLLLMEIRTQRGVRKSVKVVNLDSDPRTKPLGW